MAGVTLPADPIEPGGLARAARAVLIEHWRPEGYCVPHASTYPFPWLWDSCFHSVVWAHLGEPYRAVVELAHVFRTQDPLGFVPHVDYQVAPDHLAGFWGRTGASAITQPPMYGHAVAELTRRGIRVGPEVVGAARRGLGFLLDHRARSAGGLVTLCHPWESGADDSPRWDDWCPGGFDPARWYDVKGGLLATIEWSPEGSPLANPAFAVAPAGFNALVAFNALELASVTADDELAAQAVGLVAALDARWDADARTWADDRDRPGGSGRVCTADALLGVLVSRDAGAVDTAFAQLLDPAAFGGACGPAGVHRAEPAFAPRTYWRGPAWPQLTYLGWVAARRRGRSDVADVLAAALVRGAVASGFAEYWDADDGTALGACPQSWSTLAAVVAPVG